MSQATSEQTAVAPQGKKSGLVTTDDGEFSNLLDTAKFEHVWRVATMFSKSQLVPAHFRDRPEDCFIAVQMSIRIGIDPLMLMQNIYIVQGKPGMQAVLAIALVNSSGLFLNSLDYEIEGDDPKAQSYRVRAWAVRKSTGKRIDGPWIDWSVVKSEGWDKKGGSKWMTMPGQMFIYRAASWFARAHCPERLMGMQTTEELEDVNVISLPPQPKGTAALMTKLSTEPSLSPQTPQEPQAAEPTPEPAQTPEPPQDGPSEREQAIIQLEERYFEANPRLAKEKDDAMKVRFMRWVQATGGIKFNQWSDLADDSASAVITACNQALD